MTFNKKIITVIILLVQININAQTFSTNLDCKIYDLGNLRQSMTNMGILGAGWTNCVHTLPYASHIDFLSVRDHYQPGISEYPTGSGSYFGEYGPWFGAIINGEQRVTTTGPEWLTPYGIDINYELFPSDNINDSIWVVNRGETVNIPYWPGYTAVSDQDMVIRMNDYTITSPWLHNPLGIDVIQVTYGWSTLDFLVHQYWVIPTNYNLEDFYFSFAGNFGVGCYTTNNADRRLADNYGWWNEERKIGLITDTPRFADDDGCAIGPIGFRIFPDNEESVETWTWLDGNAGGYTTHPWPSADAEKYNFLKAGVIHDPLNEGEGNGQRFIYAVGPYQATIGDTLHFTVAQLFGKGESGVYENYDRLLKVRAQNWYMPGPPPNPPLKVSVNNHRVILDWSPESDNNPEEFTDEYRGDEDPNPFEGYRVYKSTVSASGPWTLLAEYDRTDDNVGHNLGLTHQFVDDGLLNNLEYYYSVTSFAKPDSVLGIYKLESGITANVVTAIPGTAAPDKVGQVAAVPNPYLGDEKYYLYEPAWEKAGVGGSWGEETRRIQFINLPNPCTIRIYTISGKLVDEIEHNDGDRGYEDWNLTSGVGQAISSGIYLYTVEDQYSGIQIDKLVIVK